VSKSIKKCFLVAVVFLGMASAMKAEELSQTATAKASVDILLPVAISQSANLVFGQIYRAQTTASTASIAPTATAKAIGADGATYNENSTSNAAVFLIGGELGKSIAIKLPENTQTAPLSLSGGTHTGTVDVYDFTSGEETPDNAISVSSEKLYVGATIGISADASGSFSGDFSVSINYN
jgi:hypothetical protein